MISLARIIESWRDAQIFKDPTAPRGKLWHWLKYPQYGLLIASALVYFLMSSFEPFFLPSWEWVVFLSDLPAIIKTAATILVDIGLAYLVFEFFLDYFRTKKRNEDRLARLLNSNQKDMGSGS